jgi:hypothetical protein
MVKLNMILAQVNWVSACFHPRPIAPAQTEFNILIIRRSGQILILLLLLLSVILKRYVYNAKLGFMIHSCFMWFLFILSMNYFWYLLVETIKMWYMCLIFKIISVNDMACRKHRIKNETDFLCLQSMINYIAGCWFQTSSWNLSFGVCSHIGYSFCKLRNVLIWYMYTSIIRFFVWLLYWICLFYFNQFDVWYVIVTGL